MEKVIYKKGIKIESGKYYKAEDSIIDFYYSDTCLLERQAYLSHTNAREEDEHRIAILLKDLKDVTLDFSDATLMFHGRIIPFVIDNCENVKLINYKIDYDRPFYTQAQVLDVKEKELRIKIDDGFDYKVEDGYLYAKSEYWEKKLNTKDCLLWLYDREEKKNYPIILALFGPEIFPHKNPPLPIHKILIEEDGGELILKGDFPSSWEVNNGNNSLIFTHEARDKTTITIIDSKNVYIENFTLIHGAGMAVIGMNSENLYFDNFSMYKNYQGNKRLVTNNADAIHTFNCRGELVFKNSYMDALLDDTVNVHNNYLTVKESKGNKLSLVLNGKGLGIHCPLFTKGEDIAIYKGQTLEEKGKFKIIDLNIDYENKIYYFTLDKEADNINEGDTVENLSAHPTILIENCKFGVFRGTMRLQSRNKTVVRDCEFANKEVSILFTGDTNYWYESGPVKDVLIENCKFTNSNDYHRFLFTTVADFTEEHNYYHQNITVKNCEFEGGNVAELNHVKGFNFINNKSEREMFIVSKDSADINSDNAQII